VVNPESIDLAEQILQFASCGMAILPRVDIGAISLRAQDRRGGIEILLAVKQARAVALLLLACAETVESAEEDRS
jgi:hypothetical protein